MDGEVVFKREEIRDKKEEIIEKREDKEGKREEMGKWNIVGAMFWLTGKNKKER